MDKTYSPEEIETSCYHYWESHHYFKPKMTGNLDNFCIMLPPPNVTGSLHMGHAFQQTLMDVLIREQRMQGKNTLWQPGTDHAGISTQLVVERELEKQNLYRKDMTRDQFLSHVWAWKEQFGSQITQQMRRLGSSVDWSRECFTLDNKLSAAVLKVFVQLYEEGLIYRKNRLVNWDPKLETAVSDLEVFSEEESGFLWQIRYPLVDNPSEFLTVATTRPETLFGDEALAVHPDDIRYQSLIGQWVTIPLTNKRIPIIADTCVNPEFGSGCVKITPAHDFNDHEVGLRHDLPQTVIFDKQGRLNNGVPQTYRNLTILEARQKIVEDLKTRQWLVDIKPHVLKIPRGEKSGVIIEPMLTKQWYVRTQPLAKPAIEAIKNSTIEFIPNGWDKTYFQWMENIEDWCISRQLWWGHRIPAWYDNDDNIYVGYSEQDVRFKYNLSQDLFLRQDEDVLDTWFSSALWPFSTLGWPKDTVELEKFYPTSVLITGFDIIFFWVARMIMLGLKFTGKIPFKKVIITGLVRDQGGKKMSKSKGNVLDPIDVIDGISLKDLLAKRTNHLMLPSLNEKITKATCQQFPDGIQAFGTDALRFTFCALATQGRNVQFDLKRVEGYRNFCNKLWNAARYVFMHVENEQQDLEDGAFQYASTDLWIMSRLQGAIQQAQIHLNDYRFDLLANTLYNFVWHEYCDWYLELSKPVLYNAQLSPIKRGTCHTLLSVLDSILRLLHPIIPFITETIYQKISTSIGRTDQTIMHCPYPTVDETLINLDIEQEIAWLQQIIQSVRTVRSEISLPPAVTIALLVKNATAKEQQWFGKHLSLFTSLAKLDSVEFLLEQQQPPVSISARVKNLELYVPIAKLIDKNQELLRLQKEFSRWDKEKQRLLQKLNNPQFKNKAPADIIEKEQQKLAAAEVAYQKIQVRQQLIESIEE